MKKFFADFKKFISRGSVIDMAVGVIIGAAFSAIVTSLVNDIIMPLIVRIFPVQNLADFSVVLRPESAPGVGDALTWNYGNFIAAIINFLLIALVLFFILKLFMSASGLMHPKHGVYLTKEEYKSLRREGKSKAEIAEIDRKRGEEKAAQEAAKKAAEEAESEKALLKRAVELLASIEEKSQSTPKIEK